VYTRYLFRNYFVFHQLNACLDPDKLPLHGINPTAMVIVVFLHFQIMITHPFHDLDYNEYGESDSHKWYDKFAA